MEKTRGHCLDFLSDESTNCTLAEEEIEHNGMVARRNALDAAKYRRITKSLDRARATYGHLRYL